MWKNIVCFFLTAAATIPIMMTAAVAISITVSRHIVHTVQTFKGSERHQHMIYMKHGLPSSIAEFGNNRCIFELILCFALDHSYT